ncbi:MAG: hypothetical protein ACSHXD_09475 [Marinosulfonomonas sp.]
MVARLVPQIGGDFNMCLGVGYSVRSLLKRAASLEHRAGSKPVLSVLWSSRNAA